MASTTSRTLGTVLGTSTRAVAAREASTSSPVRIEVGSTVVIPVPSLSSATEMWKNVKALEEENKRLRKELEEWVKRALELSKRLHASGNLKSEPELFKSELGFLSNKNREKQ